MNVTPLVVSFGAVGLAGITAFGLTNRLAEQEAEIGRMQERLVEAAAEPRPKSSEPAEELERLTETLAALELRLTLLEQRPTSDRRELVAAQEAASQAPAEPVPGGAASSDEEQDARAEMEEILALFAGGFDWEANGAALERFYELARETDVIDEKISELEAGVEANPGDLDGRMLLADTYVAKLMTVQGPEQGMWGMKAEKQWKSVVDLDGEHWQANYNIGNNYAYYPDVMGKTDDAIAYLEHAREIQERDTQGDEHVQTYVSLARMHQRKGDLDEARRVLEEGLRYHPGNGSLERTLASMD